MKEEEREREMVSIDQSHVAISFCQLRQERPVSLLATEGRLATTRLPAGSSVCIATTNTATYKAQ
jgi:hypothetical protein